MNIKDNIKDESSTEEYTARYTKLVMNLFEFAKEFYRVGKDEVIKPSLPKS